MASNENFGEKPNLRPTKRIAAGGKTLFLRHTPNPRSTRSYIQANWNNNSSGKSLSQEDLFGIDQSGVEYSLNKRQRWELLQKLHETPTDSSDDSDLDFQSVDERKTKKKRQNKPKRSQHVEQQQETKFRLYELQDTGLKANCVSVVSNTGAKRVQTPQKTYMMGPNSPPTRGTTQDENRSSTNENSSVDVTYYALVPAPREKHLTNIRRQATHKRQKGTTTVQNPGLTEQVEPKQITTEVELKFSSYQNKDENDEEDEDEDEEQRDWETEIFYGTRPDELKLNDFIPTIPKSVRIEQTKRISENLVAADRPDSKSSLFYLDDLEKHDSKHRFHRQISKEEKLYNRDLANYRQNNKISTAKNSVKNEERSIHKLSSFGFRSVLIEKENLDVKFLRESFGQNFVEAQCFPKKYLIRLTDRVKSMDWKEKPDLFSRYAALNCFLILVEKDSPIENEKTKRVLVALNIDLFSETIEIENLFDSEGQIYRIFDLIEKTLQFLFTLPFDIFKPLDAELTKKRIVRMQIDNKLSDSEHLNKQILQLKISEGKNLRSETNKIENLRFSPSNIVEQFEFLRPDVCTICLEEIDETISITALKSCAHFLCDKCWTNYLENAVKRVELIRCPEWNCDEVVDIGTLLSLVNVRCLNIYERNIENCLVNVSRSHIKCPAKNCSNIVPIIGRPIDHVRCSCGHEFCAQCKQEPHFPATCRAYRFYIDELYRNGDGIFSDSRITHVSGRNCISCNNFIEKNGGCNHMTCRCGAQFCWSCTAFWQDHYSPDGNFKCPKGAVSLQEEELLFQRSSQKRFYPEAVFHRRERFHQGQMKFRENANRLLSTIPLEKSHKFDSELIEKQISQRESLLRHLFEMPKYVQYLHRVCEFIAVSAVGYGNSPSEFRSFLPILESLLLNISQTFEGGRGNQAIQQINESHNKAEKLIERLQSAVQLRELRRANTTGYVTS